MVEVFSEKDWVEKTEKKTKEKNCGNISANGHLLSIKEDCLCIWCLKLKREPFVNEKDI